MCFGYILYILCVHRKCTHFFSFLPFSEIYCRFPDWKSWPGSPFSPDCLTFFSWYSKTINHPWSLIKDEWGALSLFNFVPVFVHQPLQYAVKGTIDFQYRKCLLSVVYGCVFVPQSEPSPRLDHMQVTFLKTSHSLCSAFSYILPALFSFQKLLVSPGVQMARRQNLTLPCNLAEPCFGKSG